jgi:dGTPase
MTTKLYTDYLKEIIKSRLRLGEQSLTDILNHCEGADPKSVLSIVEELVDKDKKLKKDLKEINGKEYIGISSSLDLPAPDPSLSQWWFAASGTSKIITEVLSRAIKYDKPQILCIGTPSLVKRLSNKYYTTILDIDSDVIRILNKEDEKNYECYEYDIYEELSDKFKDKYDICVIDPPWYDNDIKIMLNRAIEAIKIGGDIFCTLPGRLTRPDIEEFRTKIINEIVTLGHNIIALNHDNILYQVPPFEAIAFNDIAGFTGVPWRKGDLIHLSKGNQDLLKTENNINRIKIKSFSRKAEEFRVFINYKNSLSGGLPPEPLQNYSNNISTRAYKGIPDFWTTTKVGLKVSDFRHVEYVLECWSKGMCLEETIVCLSNDKGIESDRAEVLVNTIEKFCALWSKYIAPKVFRSPEDILKQSQEYHSDLATPASQRLIQEDSDSFRPQYSRDRDRLIWSNSLKGLADKTQLFPSKADDSVRRRLTHTLEVMQLASTIGTNLGLDNDLIEASALAHDLGHTPFGHAGEFAINGLFNNINESLDGFNHYEHGLDVVQFIESPYITRINNPFFGLNLSPEILESIIKHTFSHSSGKLSSINLVKNSKHWKVLIDGYCHLEGQTVRIADKVSYLISDIEDGIRLGAITILDLLECKLFHHPLLYFDKNSKEPLLNQYLNNRNNLIKILMEDIIKASTHSISQADIKNVDSVRNHGSYLIRYSDNIQADTNEIWNKLQTNCLFNNKKVLSSNLFAAKVVSELVLLFTLIPSLIDEKFRQNHYILRESEYIKEYEKRVGPKIIIIKEMVSFMPFHLMIGSEHSAYNDIPNIPVHQLIQAKDYVCTLSDYKARILHREILNDTIDT